MKTAVSLCLSSVAALLFLSACSSTPSDELDYQGSEITPTLEMPPNIIRRESQRNLKLPGTAIGEQANVGRFVETGSLKIGQQHLPNLAGMELMGQGDMVWLEVPSSVDEVYPLMRDFWRSEGYELAMDEPLMGIMKTSWMSGKAGATGFFSRMLESMRNSEFKDQYTTRINRDLDGNGSQVFIAHRGQELVLEGDEQVIAGNRNSGWNFTPADPAKEAEMLSRLMVFLGMQDEAARAQLARIGSFAPRAELVRGNPEEDEASYVEVSQSFEQTWNRLRHQLDRFGVLVKQAKRDDLEGELLLDTASFFSEEKPVGVERSTLQLNLEGQQNADLTRIELIDEKGSTDRSEESVRILRAVAAILG